jgi:hypothetical protein
LKTTYKKLIEHEPCISSVNKMLEYNNLEPIENLSDLDPSIDLSTEISLKEALDICGIQDAIWCLRAFPYRDCCLFLADVAEMVLPIFEKHVPGDTRVRDCIDAIRKWHSNEIDNVAMGVARDAAWAAASNAVRAAARDAARATAFGCDVARAAAIYAVSAAASDAARAAALGCDAARAAANAAACAAARDAVSAVASDAASAAAWEKIKKMFEKYYV